MITRAHHDNASAEGKRRKADAHTLFEERRQVYIRRGRRALLLAMLAGDGRGTADDVQAGVDLPPGIDPVCLGAVPTVLARAGIIARTGFAQTTRPTAHARPVSVWALRDRGAAEQWLADHPDLADPDEGERRADGPQRLLFSIHPRNDTGAAVAAAAPVVEA